ncbi:MAG: hypothetical protein ABI454_02165, partial [Sphingomicrobium sp.]
MPRNEGFQFDRPARRLNRTVLALLGGVVVLFLLVAYFATNRNSDQDKLTGNAVSETQAGKPEKSCASQATYDLIKHELFRRAAQLRGSDQGAYDKLSAYAVVRMENPVLESEDKDTGGVNCSGTLSLDLPPGVAVVGGRRTLTSDVDYTVQPAADGSGNVVLLRNADAIIAPLATLGRVGQPAQPPAAPAEGNVVAVEQPPTSAPVSQPALPPTPAPAPARNVGRPSFDCSKARTRGETAVCSDAGLSALDRNMATQYVRSMAGASPEEQALLRRTRDRFLAYRDRCPDRKCIGNAYVGRMREIRDIMEGR